MPNTPRMSWPFPARFEEPYFEAIEAYFAAADASGYAAREDRHLVLSGGGTISWDATLGVLTWTEDLQILAAITGFQWTIQGPGQITIDIGQMVYVNLVRAPTVNQTVTLQAGNQVPNTDNALLIAVRIGSNLWFINGGVITDGGSLSGIGGSGALAPENFSYKTVPSSNENGSGHSGTVTVPEFQQMIVHGGLVINGTLDVFGEVVLI